MQINIIKDKVDIVFISCVKTKKKGNHKAKDIYISNYFGKRLQFYKNNLK